MITDAQRHELQMKAESRMRDTVRITVAGAGGPVWDEESGTYVPVDATPLWVGPCRIRTGGNIAAGATRDVGGDQVSVSTPTLIIPISVVPVPVDAVCVIVAVPADDPGGKLRLGLTMKVTGPIVQTDGTAQRLQVQIDHG